MPGMKYESGYKQTGASKASAFILLLVLTIAACAEQPKPDARHSDSRTNSLQPQSVCLLANQNTLSVVLAQSQATAAEKKAADELVFHLARMTDKQIVLTEDQNLDRNQSIIWIGATDLSMTHARAPKDYTGEESEVRLLPARRGFQLILTGGRPRGTLYAVYNFLQKDLGVRWYTPRSTKIPRNRDLCFEHNDRVTAPRFSYRDHDDWLAKNAFPNAPTYFNDVLAWKIRNRLNGPKLNVWSPETGGIKMLGPHPHSFSHLVDPKIWFKEPKAGETDYREMFSWDAKLKKRVHSRQLCLTNTNTRDVVVASLKKLFAQSPSGGYAWVAPNDKATPHLCDCDACKAKAEAYGGESGLLLWFVNQVAKEVDGPGRTIVTQAYNTTVVAPSPNHGTKTDPKKSAIRADPNVVVNLVAFSSGMVNAPGTHQVQTQRYREWKAHADRIWLFDRVYNNRTRMGYLKPITFLQNDVLRLAGQHQGTDGYFQEDEIWKWEQTLFNQFREMNSWLSMQMLQDADQDLGELIWDFLEGNYGNAAPALFDYLLLVENNRHLWPYRMFSLNFLRDAQFLFGQALNATASDPVHYWRVRHLRLSVDLVTMANSSRVIDEHLAEGGSANSLPFDMAALEARSREVANLDMDLVFNPFAHPLLGMRVYVAPNSGVWPAGLSKYKMAKTMLLEYIDLISPPKNPYAPLPSIFQNLSEDLVDIPPALLADKRIYLDTPNSELLSLDNNTPFGKAVERPLKTCNPQNIGAKNDDCIKSMYIGASVSGYSDQATKVPQRLISVANSEGGYHWYRAKRFNMGPLTKVLINGWHKSKTSMLIPLDHLHDPNDPKREWDLYVSIKFEHDIIAADKMEQRYFVDRIVLLPAAAANPTELSLP